MPHFGDHTRRVGYRAKYMDSNFERIIPLATLILFFNPCFLLLWFVFSSARASYSCGHFFLMGGGVDRSAVFDCDAVVTATDE